MNSPNRTVPPRYGESCSRTAVLSKGLRCVVENTQCIRHELKECMILPSLRDLTGLFDEFTQP